MKIPILLNHDVTRAPFGFLDPRTKNLLEDFLERRGNCILAPGYIKNDDGSVELIEISIVDVSDPNREIDRPPEKVLRAMRDQMILSGEEGGLPLQKPKVE